MSPGWLELCDTLENRRRCTCLQLERSQECHQVGDLVRCQAHLETYAIGAGVGHDNEYKGAVALGMGLMGLGIGSAVGGVLPIGPPLYEAERVRRATTGAK